MSRASDNLIPRAFSWDFFPELFPRGKGPVNEVELVSALAQNFSPLTLFASAFALAAGKESLLTGYRDRHRHRFSPGLPNSHSLISLRNADLKNNSSQYIATRFPTETWT